MNLKQYINENFKQLGDVLLNIFPQNRKELTVFLFCEFFYLSYSLILVFNSNITDFPSGVADLYFSFDNASIFQKGYDNIEGHPLMDLFTRPFMFWGIFLVIIFNYKFRSVLYIFLCTLLISFSVTYVFRYLRDIVELKGYPLYLLIIFYGFFTTNLILCFTTETYTISVFLLTLTLYYYSYCIAKDKKVNFLPNLFFSFTLGGITITNFVKGIIPMLFTKEKWSLIIKKVIALGLIFGLALATVIFRNQDILNRIMGRGAQYAVAGDSSGSFFEKIVDLFFGAQILSPKIIFVLSDFFRSMGMDVELISGTIEFEFYHHWWQYLIIGIISLLMLLSAYKNYKNRLVQMLVLFFGVDIILHVVLKYGIISTFIYGGHWIYVVPLLLGWLYRSINKQQQKVFLGVMTCIVTVICINNITELIRFMDFAIEYFPVKGIPAWRDYLK